MDAIYRAGNNARFSSPRPEQYAGKSTNTNISTCVSTLTSKGNLIQGTLFCTRYRVKHDVANADADAYVVICEA